MTKNANTSDPSGRDELSSKGGTNPLSEVTVAGSYSPEELKKFQTKEDHEKLVKWVKDNYAKCRDQLGEIKAQWNLNLSFYRGDQYVDKIKTSSGQFAVVPIPAPRSKPRLVVNRIKPMVRTEIARLTSTDPTAEVVPATS